MRAFNLTTPTRDTSYANAIQAGSLAHTGNSMRPVGGPQQPYQTFNTNFSTPVSGPMRPVANPIRVTNGSGTGVTQFNFANGIVHRPNAPQLPYRGIVGQ